MPPRGYAADAMRHAPLSPPCARYVVMLHREILVYAYGAADCYARHAAHEADAYDSALRDAQPFRHATPPISIRRRCCERWRYARALR